MDFNKAKYILEATNQPQEDDGGIKHISKDQIEAAKYNFEKKIGKEPEDKNSKEWKAWKHEKENYEKSAKKASNYARYLESQAKAGKEVLDTDKRIFNRGLRAENLQNVNNNLNSSTPESLKMITSFLHKNVSKDMDAKPEDVTAFKLCANGQAINVPGKKGYLSRWKHIVTSMLAAKGSGQSDEQRFLNHETKIATGEANRKYNYEIIKDKNGKNKSKVSLGMSANNPNYKSSDYFSAGAQGNQVIVSYDDYMRIKETKAGKDLPMPKTKGNQMIPARLAKNKELYKTGGVADIKTKTSDYIVNVNVKEKGEIVKRSLFVTFKSVKNDGGSQDNQVAEVIKTLNSLKSNVQAKQDVKSIAVIDGENITNKLRRDPKTGVTYVMIKSKDKKTGKDLITNKYFNPIDVETSSGKIMHLPRVISYAEWLKILPQLKKHSEEK